MSLSTLLSTCTRSRALRGLVAASLCLGIMDAAQAQAQTPNLIGYQAAVFDDQGQPVEGSVDVDIALYNAASGGTEMYAESHPGVALVAGTFDIQIGSGSSPSGTFDASTFATSEAWLELTVDGEVLDPRQRLVAVPYALRAKVAESLDGSIGTVPFANEAGHAATADTLISAPTAGSPSQLLAVHVDETGTPLGDGARVFFDQTYVDGVNHDALVFEKVDRGGNNPDGSIVFANKGVDGISEHSMIIRGDGKVGIGTDTPSARLHVVDPNGYASWFQNDSSSSTVYIGNAGTGRAMYVAANGSGLNQATIRSLNLNPNGGVAGFFDNLSAQPTLAAYNNGPGEGLVVQNTGESEIISAWTLAPGASTSTRQFWVGGDGITNVRTLQIHGGADLSENFDIAPRSSELGVEPGTIVAIDPEDPGKLVVSEGAYSRTVAGVVAGAGGIQPGMLLRQEGVAEADGEHPVALTGRVYARADTSGGPIRPGDLLTTSDRAGHAMKATDWQRSQGAVLGKAMGRLDEGTGLVLVLVGLQ